MTFEPARARTWALLIGAMVGASTLGVGLVADDHAVRAILKGMRWMPASKWELYLFGTGDPALMRPLIEHGPYPWWTWPEFKVHFFRPLSSFLMWLDVQLFGSTAWLAHLHSVAWWLFGLGAATEVLRRLAPPRVAGVAMVLFALDDVHVIPVGWIANRHVVVSGAMMLWGFWAWLCWRQDAKRWGLPLAVALFLAGLAGGESALATFALIACWELGGNGAPWRGRLLAVAGLSALALGYLLVYRALGFGAYGSAIYLDPGSQLGMFLRLAPQRLLALMAPLTLNVPSDGFTLTPTVAIVISALGSLGVLIWSLAFRGLWASLDPERRAAVRWMVPAALLSLVPSLATFPSDRMLFSASLMSAVVLATLLDAAIARGGGVRRLGLALAAPHVVLPVVLWLFEPWLLRAIDDGYTRASLQTAVPEPALKGRVLYVNAPDLLAGAYAPIFRFDAGLGASESWNVLSASPSDLRLTRTTERSFRLESVGAPFMSTAIEGLFRNPEMEPFAVDDSARISGASVRVVAVEKGLPTAIAIELDEPVEAYTLVQWKGRQLQPLVLPSIGDTIALPHEPGPPEWLFRGGSLRD